MYQYFEDKIDNIIYICCCKNNRRFADYIFNSGYYLNDDEKNLIKNFYENKKNKFSYKWSLRYQ